jgi:hypothetical protein
MQAAGAALNAALVEVGRLADALVGGAGEAGELSATSRDGVGRLKPVPPMQADADRIVSQTQKLASSSDAGDPLRGALEEVGRLAGALVSGGGATSASFALPGAPTAATPQGRYPAGQTLGQTANFRQSAPEIHVSPGFADPDAEWLAALVNEALAEQARRHGVDLS